MTDSGPDIVVLRCQAHGLGADDYYEALRDRLPAYDIRLANTPSEERELVRDAPVVTGHDFGQDLLDAAEKLKYFAAGSAGVEYLPLDEFAERGIVVTNASGAHVPNMTEHALGWMFMIARRLDEGLRRQRRREWRRYPAFGTVTGSTVTIVGLGPIGRSIADHLQPFDVDTIGVRYTPSKGGPTDEVIGYEFDALHDAYARTDYLVLACPLTETTANLIDAEALHTLPVDSVLINVARGRIVETDALVDAVWKNGIHAVALDVTDPEPLPEDHPLWRMENVFITPHVSGHTEEYWERTADILERNLRQVAETGEYEDLENQVSLVE